MSEREDVLRVKICQDIYQDFFKGFDNVVGVATGYRQRRGRYTKEVCIQVFVEQKRVKKELKPQSIIPHEVIDPSGKAVRVDIIETGPFSLLQDTNRYRPVPGGSSIGGLTRLGGGTLGGYAHDTTDDTIVFLTNNHVVTDETNRQEIPVISGIVQPAQIDGGTAPADLIGRAKRIVPISVNPDPNLAPVTAVDAAIGTATADWQASVLQIGPAIYEIGAPTLGMRVQKKGKGTGLTQNGTITSINMMLPPINYGPPGAPAWARIGTGTSVFLITATQGQIFAGAGDSGSLIFDQAPGQIEETFPVVGLLFVANPAGNVAAACNIAHVFDAFNLATVCNYYVRALIEAIGRGGMTTSSASMPAIDRRTINHKERQLRRFRDEILSKYPIGKFSVELFLYHFPQISKAIFGNEEAFGLSLKLLAPWVLKNTNKEILDTKIEKETIQNFTDLSRYLARSDRSLRQPLGILIGQIKNFEGHTVREVLEETKTITKKR